MFKENANRLEQILENSRKGANASRLSDREPTFAPTNLSP